jgi:hypothetical protein
MDDMPEPADAPYYMPDLDFPENDRGKKKSKPRKAPNERKSSRAALQRFASEVQGFCAKTAGVSVTKLGRHARPPETSFVGAAPPVAIALEPKAKLSKRERANALAKLKAETRAALKLITDNLKAGARRS